MLKWPRIASLIALLACARAEAGHSCRTIVGADGEKKFVCEQNSDPDYRAYSEEEVARAKRMEVKPAARESPAPVVDSSPAQEGVAPQTHDNSSSSGNEKIRGCDFSRPLAEKQRDGTWKMHEFKSGESADVYYMRRPEYDFVRFHRKDSLTDILSWNNDYHYCHDLWFEMRGKQGVMLSFHPHANTAALIADENAKVQTIEWALDHSYLEDPYRWVPMVLDVASQCEEAPGYQTAVAPVVATFFPDVEGMIRFVHEHLREHTQAIVGFNARLQAINPRRDHSGEVRAMQADVAKKLQNCESLEKTLPALKARSAAVPQR